MKRTLFIVVILVTTAYLKSNAQGCVAIRSNGNTCISGKAGETKALLFNFNTRYFKSYKHFVGTEEQHERVDSGTQVINHSLNWDLTLTKIVDKYWSFSVNVPIISNVRSSLYEHYGNVKNANARNRTRSFGVGDIRLAAYRWIFDPARSHNGNLQVGLGIKLPTGDYKYQDYFHRLTPRGTDSSVLGPVDQSIQLGDGGTGLSLELNGYYNFSARMSAYGNFYYLANPREQNGTPRSIRLNRNDTLFFNTTMSVADQYMVRGGVTYALTKNMNISGGFRMEAIPSSDLIGGDKGFRRPGYVMSAEPTITYITKKATFYFSVPVAFERNRIQSNFDKLRSKATGTHQQGDAAFADYLINVGFSIHL